MTRATKWTLGIVIMALLAIMLAILAEVASLLSSDPTTHLLNYNLAAAGDEVPYCTSATGTNTLALPFVPGDEITSVEDLINSIEEAGGGVQNVKRFNPANDSFEDFESPEDFWSRGEALFVQMDGGVNYRVAGSHDPSSYISLLGPESPLSSSGMNFVALPLTSSAVDAQGLIDQIGSEYVEEVQRFNECTDQWESWAGGGSGGTNFTIKPGEGYKVKMSVSREWTPEFMGATAAVVHYDLAATGDEVPYCRSDSGTNTLALPYNRQLGINNAQDLIESIGGDVLKVQRFEEASGEFEEFDGSGVPFDLYRGEALLVQMDSSVNYSIVGAHDPTIQLQLESPGVGGNVTGKSFVALPYHSTAVNAQALIDEIGSENVESVERFNECTDQWEPYFGGKIGGTNFTIKPGEGYFVKMKSTVVYTPQHY